MFTLDSDEELWQNMWPNAYHILVKCSTPTETTDNMKKVLRLSSNIILEDLTVPLWNSRTPEGRMHRARKAGSQTLQRDGVTPRWLSRHTHSLHIQILWENSLRRWPFKNSFGNYHCGSFLPLLEERKRESSPPWVKGRGYIIPPT